MKAGSDYKDVTPEVGNIKIPQEQKKYEEPTIRSVGNFS